MLVNRATTFLHGDSQVGSASRTIDARWLSLSTPLILIALFSMSACASFGRDRESIYWDVAVEENIYIQNLTTSRRNYYAVLAWLENVETGEVVFALKPNMQDLNTLLDMGFRTPPGRYRGVYSCDVTRLQLFEEITGISGNQALKGQTPWGEERGSTGHVFDQTIPAGVQLGARNIRPKSGNLLCTPFIANGRQTVYPDTRRVGEAIERAEASGRFYLNWLQ